MADLVIPEEALAKMMEKHEEKQATLTQEQRDENKAKFQALLADPAKMEEAKADGHATFVAADADGNGSLNKAEFFDHARKGEANAKAKGWHIVETTDEELENWFTKICELAGADEVSEAAHQAITKQFMGAVIAKEKAKEGQ